MKEKDIHKLIEQQNPEAKQRLWERIKAELDLPDSPRVIARAAAKSNRWKQWTAIVLAVFVVVTLSIVLPLTLRGHGARFCDATQYTAEDLGQTLKEYSVAHNNELLYVDWYDVAGSLTTTEYGYNNKDKNDVIYFKESIISGDTGETVILSVTDNKTRVDIFNKYYNGEITAESKIKEIVVRWKNVSLRSTAIFEYKNYTYIIELDGSQARLTEIIETMLK